MPCSIRIPGRNCWPCAAAQARPRAHGQKPVAGRSAASLQCHAELSSMQSANYSGRVRIQGLPSRSCLAIAEPRARRPYKHDQTMIRNIQMGQARRARQRCGRLPSCSRPACSHPRAVLRPRPARARSCHTGLKAPAAVHHLRRRWRHGQGTASAAHEWSCRCAGWPRAQVAKLQPRRSNPMRPPGAASTQHPAPRSFKSMPSPQPLQPPPSRLPLHGASRPSCTAAMFQLLCCPRAPCRLPCVVVGACHCCLRRC